MPKIFLIKNRLHQQQLKLLESQNLLAAKNDLELGVDDDSHNGDGQNEPLSLVARNRDRDNNDAGKNELLFFFNFLFYSVYTFLNSFEVKLKF